jgi:hypothetical protein
MAYSVPGCCTLSDPDSEDFLGFDIDGATVHINNVRRARYPYYLYVLLAQRTPNLVTKNACRLWLGLTH